jgi:hypothetical protein
MSTTTRRVALRAGLGVMAAIAVAAGSILAAGGMATAAESAPGPVASATLKPGEKLGPGQEIKSANGRFVLRQQEDGNLVFFENTGRVVWHAGTAPNPGAVTTMQRDGHLTVVSASGRPLWGSGTKGTGVTLHAQNDGNLTIRLPDGKVLWAVSDVIFWRSQVRTGEVLKCGDERKSLDLKITLRMQCDGNLVLLDQANKVLWHAGTAPNDGARATMQQDGNFTIVTASNRPIFHTATQGANLAMHVQNDGKLTLRTPDGKVLWATRW